MSDPSQSKPKRTLILILFTIFLDLLGVGLVLPILPSLFDPNLGVFGNQLDPKFATIIYGFLVASYPLAQLFGAPILGFLSDVHGRKKILALSVVGTILSLLIFALGIYQKNLWLMFASRLLDGFTGGNISIAQSIIGDISQEKEKTRNFGLIGVSLGLGFIVGPIFGGILSDAKLVSWFNFTIPYLFAAILSIINLFFIIKFLTETAVKRDFSKQQKQKLHIFMSFEQLYRAFTDRKLRVVFLVNFLVVFAFSLFTTFSQTYLQRRFALSQSEIGLLLAYVGIWIAVTQGILLPLLAKKWSIPKILNVGLLGTGLSLIIIMLPNKASWFYLLLPLVAVFNGITIPNTTAILSDSVSKEKQGEIMGVNQSVQAFATLAPMFAGFGANVWIKFPILISAIACLLAWVIFSLFHKEEAVQE